MTTALILGMVALAAATPAAATTRSAPPPGPAGVCSRRRRRSFRPCRRRAVAPRRRRPWACRPRRRRRRARERRRCRAAEWAPPATRSALQQVRHVRDDDVAAEEQRALHEQGRLVVQDVLPPAARQELRQHDRYHPSVAAGPYLLDVIEQRAQERPVRRRQHDQGHAEPPARPLLLDA